MVIGNQNKLLILYFTQKGKSIAEELIAPISKDMKVKLYDGMKEKKLKDKIEDYSKIYSHFLFISSTGIAVRYISKIITSKQTDPSVTVLSDSGKYTIPLLSSHMGGGIHVAHLVSEILSNELVITTATDSENIMTPDKEAYLLDKKVVNKDKIKLINSLLLKGGEISKDLNEESEAYCIERSSFKEIERYISEIKLDEKVKKERLEKTLFIISDPLAVGIGCRRGKEAEKIEAFLKDTLEKYGRSVEDVKYIASAMAKKDEAGIIELSKKIGAKLIIHEDEDIKAVQDNFKKSDFVKNTIGLYNVSSSSAYLIYRNLITEKEINDGITISISHKIDV